ncbi:hypothetical protein ACIBCT_35280 [Streptosporangium sp. NPDC050855]|uniref:hypothetical protein n=1 Tax=Streptosporangium sp. NPDC050855 TaxID=3366194 RepID=UPI0037BBC446
MLVLDVEENYGYGHIYARPRVENNGFQKYADAPVLLSPGLGDRYGWDEPYNHLGNLRASCQYDVTNRSCVYGYEIEYADMTRVRTREAEVMAKALRKIDREMNKLRDAHGYPDSYGEYLAHFAAAIGCNRFAIRHREMRANGTHYQWLDVAGMRSWVAQQTADKVSA